MARLRYDHDLTLSYHFVEGMMSEMLVEIQSVVHV